MAQAERVAMGLHCLLRCSPLKQRDGRDGCNGSSGRDHAAPRWGAAHANGLAIRYGHNEGSGRDHAAPHWGAA